MHSLPWYHSIELPGGLTTPGVVKNAQVLPRLDLPSDMTGKSVLDVGAWDGFYSFECARRGATSVLATDSFVWDGRGWGNKRSFEFARQQLGLEGRVDDMLVDPMEIDRVRLGRTFDIVLFLGVLYHLREPIDALARISDVCTGLLVLETESAFNWLKVPAARLHPDDTLNSDPTNWYQFNVPALLGLLRHVGFARAEVKYRYPLMRRVARAGRDRITGRGAFVDGLRSSRVVIHASK